MSPTVRVLALLLAALALVPALAPPGAAHISGFSQGKSMDVGPYLAYVATQGPAGSQPEDVFAQTSLTFTAQLARRSDGSLVTTLPGTISLAGPDGWTKTLEMQSDNTGFLVASAVLPAPGNYSVTFGTRDEGGSYQNGSTIQAYPNLPFRIRAVDPGQDILAGARTSIALETLDPVTLDRVNAFDDLQIDVERWSDDHSTKYSQETVDARHAGVGLWKIDYVFDQPSMFHLRFASRSGGFNMTDVPIMHLYATQPSSAATAKSPGAGFVGVSVAAVAAALVARRR